MNEENTNIPIQIAVGSFKAKLTNLINKSGLPACVLSSILQNYLTECEYHEKMEYEISSKEYIKQIDKNEEGK